jgi:SRSO17 transposase
MFVIGLAVFTAASLAIALAVTPAWLIAAPHRVRDRRAIDARAAVHQLRRGFRAQSRARLVQGSLPVAWRLYLPHEWADDVERRRKAGVPEDARFATKPQTALQQLEALLAQGAPRHCVLADAGYGVDTAFRQRLSELGLPYVVGITSAVVVWPPGIEPLPPKPYRGMGRPPAMPRRTSRRQPMSVKELAQSLPPTAFQTISWRVGTNET